LKAPNTSEGPSDTLDQEQAAAALREALTFEIGLPEVNPTRPLLAGFRLRRSASPALIELLYDWVREEPTSQRLEITGWVLTGVSCSPRTFHTCLSGFLLDAMSGDGVSENAREALVCALEAVSTHPPESWRREIAHRLGQCGATRMPNT
jgi:hypothetical protein